MSFSKTSLKRNWFILTSLVSKDFKLKYRRSVLGVAWSVLNPLLMMIVLAAVFSVVFRGTIEPFPVYLILGQTLFTFMSDATSGAMGSIIESAPLIKKIRINKMLFPLEKVMFALLNFAISLIAVAIVMVFFQVVPTFNILLLPVLLAYLFMFSLGLGLLLAALSVFFSRHHAFVGCHSHGMDLCDTSFLLYRDPSRLDGLRDAVQPYVLLRHLLPRDCHVGNNTGSYRKPHLLRMWSRCARFRATCISQAAKEIHIVRLETRDHYA
ncbi:ABC transporter permease [Gordonibacter urolithinfaciens]|uniref:ABC transporter permease n=1 Tax=Gordonibacter urolithinfaciens TaxID=1335613 RepID=UPI001E5EA74D|nr:ABC transporter permease [Gordonibacter urolithinfaciens]